MRTAAIDILGIVGISSLGYGCWMVKPALCFIVVGILFLAAAVQGAYR